MTRDAYLSKMQVLGIVLIALLALGVFWGSRAEPLLDVARLVAGEGSSSTEANLSTIHPADRKFSSGNYGMASAQSRNATAAAAADRKLLDPGYLELLREQITIRGASVHPADRKFLDLGYLETVSGQQPGSSAEEIVHPADRKFFTGFLTPAGLEELLDTEADIHPADRKFLYPAYARDQTTTEGR